MVSQFSVVFCSAALIGILLQTGFCYAEQVGPDSYLEGTYDDGMEEKRGGGRAFAQQYDLKRGGGRAFVAAMNEKRGGGRGFNFAPMDKRGGGRAFYGYGSPLYQYPLIYKKADYIPYYLEYKRGGARSFGSSA